MDGIRGRTLLAAGAGLGLVLVGGPARAAGGGLELMPDFTRTLPILVLLFFVLVPVLKGLLFEPLLTALHTREEKIDGARRHAERITREAETALATYEEQIRAAREEGERQRKSLVEEARRDHAAAVATERGSAEQTIERARGEIRTALDQARDQLRSEAQELARDAASRILGRAL